MYKTKITQWGLDKKNKENDILAIVRKTTQRAAVGKKSIFRVRGRVLDPDEIERYLKRKRISVELVQMQSASTPPGLECFTPSEVPSSPRTPEVFSVSEHIFILIRDYITGSFESGTWVSETCRSVKSSASTRIAEDNLVTCSQLACEFFDDELPEDGARMLVTATAGIQKLLMAETLGLMIDVFYLILYLCRRRRPEIIPHVLRQLSDMAAIVLPARHPIGQLCGYLFSLEFDPLTDLAIGAWQSALDRFESIVGRTHEVMVQFRIDESWNRMNHELDQAESSLRSLLQTCNAVHGNSHVTSLMILPQIAELLMDQGKYAEAEDTARDCVARAVHVDSQYTTAYHCEGLKGLGRAQSGLGKTNLAEKSFRKAIELGASVWGWSEPGTIATLNMLERYLVEWGRTAAAAEVGTQTREFMKSLDVFV